MKPKEFDGLIRQKFDQNDFEYNPANWDSLSEKLDGSAKKRSIILWWWVPLAGMAASVALAFGVTTLLRQGTGGNTGAGIAHVQKSNGAHAVASGSHTLPGARELAQNESTIVYTPNSVSAGNTHKHTASRKHTTVTGNEPEESETDKYGISFRYATQSTVVMNAKPFSLLSKDGDKQVKKNKQIVINEGINTFKPEETAQVQKVPKLSIILSGGVNHGNQNSGYMAGATIRRMINDKVYVEGDVAFASSNNTQSTEYMEQHVSSVTVARHMSTGRTTSAENSKSPVSTVTTDVIKQKDVSYDLYYAQVTPGIGYKIIKRMSIGVGPDFQKVLADNRPAPSTVDRGTVQVAPLFDVGFIGKSEYAITKKVKAAVYYRKGVNNIITPVDKFIDRDYLQFQVKYTIFNK